MRAGRIAGLVAVLLVVLAGGLWLGGHPAKMPPFLRDVFVDESADFEMADQIVITEKTSQAKDVRAAVGSRYGDILPAEGHLIDLQEPEEAVPAWKRWSPILLRPEGLYGTRPAVGGNKAAKVANLALPQARRVVSSRKGRK